MFTLPHSLNALYPYHPHWVIDTPVELTSLEVSVTATVDVRGAMAVDPSVPVGFQTMACHIHFRAKEGAPPELLEKLKLAAERCWIVQQTLKSPPPVKTTFTTSGLARSDA